MKQLKINIPEGYQIKSFDEKTGEVHFELIPLDITDRIKTFDDVLIYLKMDAKHVNELSIGLSKDEVAYRKLKLIVKVLNEGWTPDWSNGNQFKYYPSFTMNSPSDVVFPWSGYDGWTKISYVGSRLCFKSSKLAEHAGKTFTSIYHDFMK